MARLYQSKRKALVVGLALLWSCGVAPIRSEPGPPARHSFVGAHGIPIAYGGGVCPFEAPHTHSYPAVPAAAFIECDGRAVETRPLFAFSDGHARERSSCFIDGFHMHVEPPTAQVRWDEERAAYVASDERPAEPHACDDAPCAHVEQRSACPEEAD